MSETHEFPTVQRDGVTTHVLVPVEEFARMSGRLAAGPRAGEVGGGRREGGMEDGGGRCGQAPSEEAVADALRILDDPGTEWHDAENVLWDLLRDGIRRVRLERGLTQQQLADALGISQPQVSRVEANIGAATLQLLRRVAAVMAERDGQRKEAS